MSMPFFRSSLASSSRRSGVLGPSARLLTRSSSITLAATMIASAMCALLMAWSNGCIDGATPNCAGDAGCGPGIDGGPLDAVSDVNAATDAPDAHAAADGSDAAPDVVPDATSDVIPDALQDSPASSDATDGSPLDVAQIDAPAKG